MTHYWIQTWQGLCVYYITRHQAHLSVITYIPPPHQEGEKGESERGGERERERGQCQILPRALHRGCFFLQVRPILCSQLAVTQLSFSSLLLSSSFFSLCFLCWEPVKYKNTRVHPGTPKTILPAGIFGEILETHQRGHPTLLSSHTGGKERAWADLGITNVRRCPRCFHSGLLVIESIH